MDIKEATHEIILKEFCGDNRFKKNEKSGTNRKQFDCLNEMRDVKGWFDLESVESG